MRVKQSIPATTPPASIRRRVLVVLAMAILMAVIAAILWRIESPPAKPASSPPARPAEVTPGQAYQQWREAMQRRREATAARKAAAAGPVAPVDGQPTTWDVLDSARDGDHVSALVCQPGPLPWVRVEAVVEVDEFDGVTNQRLVGRQSLAADRMEVRLKEGAAISAIDAWLAGQGARLAARPGEPEVFDVIWDKPELQTLPRAVALLATQPEWFAHVQPVTAQFDHAIFNFADPAPGGKPAINSSSLKTIP